MGRPKEDVGTQKDLCLYRIQAAKENLKSARILLDADGYFNKKYVKTEIFSRELGRKIGEAEEIRHASDYDDFYIASREEAERQIVVADEFIEQIEKYCKEQIE